MTFISVQEHLSLPLGDLTECITPAYMASSTLVCCVVSLRPFRWQNSAYSFPFFLDVGFPSVYYEYALLPLVNKEAASAYDRVEEN